MNSGGGYPSYLLRAMIKAGVRFPARIIKGVNVVEPLDESESNLVVAHNRVVSAVAKAEAEGARAKIRAMLLANRSK